MRRTRRLRWSPFSGLPARSSAPSIALTGRSSLLVCRLLPSASRGAQMIGRARRWRSDGCGSAERGAWCPRLLILVFLVFLRIRPASALISQSPSARSECVQPTAPERGDYAARGCRSRSRRSAADADTDTQLARSRQHRAVGRGCHRMAHQRDVRW